MEYHIPLHRLLLKISCSICSAEEKISWCQICKTNSSSNPLSISRMQSHKLIIFSNFSLGDVFQKKNSFFYLNPKTKNLQKKLFFSLSYWIQIPNFLQQNRKNCVFGIFWRKCLKLWRLSDPIKIMIKIFEFPVSY